MTKTKKKVTIVKALDIDGLNDIYDRIQKYSGEHNIPYEDIFCEILSDGTIRVTHAQD